MSSSNYEWGEYIRSKEFFLDRAALMIAKSLQYQSLDIDEHLQVLDEMGNELKDLIGSRKRPTEIIASINEYMFEKQGFKGNREDYYDPRNSYLNDVIARKTGIPITLSVLYMELARRVGFELQGVGFPWHFLVKYVYHDIAIVIDTFNKGRILAQEDFQHLLDQLYNGQVRFEQRFLASVTNEQILIRMLRNLKDAYMHSYDYNRALSATDMVITIDPNLAEEFRDKGLIFYQKKLYSDALSNLTKYLEMQPDAGDADSIYQIITDIQSLFRHDMYG
jgi:regulator of sirC expression with transglutaminase-like and TPR domain